MAQLHKVTSDDLVRQGSGARTAQIPASVYEMHKVTSTDPARSMLHEIRINQKRAIASDGHVLVRVDLTEDNKNGSNLPAIDTVLAPTQAKTDIKSARKLGFGHIDPEAPASQFPSMDKVIPNTDNRTVKVGVNAQKLADLMSVLKRMIGKSEHYLVSMSLDGPNNALVFETHDSGGRLVTALLMPVRLPEEEK